MPDLPDPLGKRALFWAPAQRQEVGPRRPEERDLPGRHALFSTTATAGHNGSPARTREPRFGAEAPRIGAGGTGAKKSGPSRRSVPGVKGRAGPAASGPAGANGATATAGRATAGRAKAEVTKTRRGSVGLIGLTCSRCGTDSDVDVLRYVTLHVPVWFWRPGRGYTSYMKCPACARRTWVSATWAPWRR